MKRIYALTLLTYAIAFSGCSTLKQGEDALVVRAEQVASTAFHTFDSFLNYEYNSNGRLGSEAHRVASEIRRSAPIYLIALRSATKAYKASESDSDRDDVTRALNAVTFLLDAVRQIQGPKAPATENVIN